MKQTRLNVRLSNVQKGAIEYLAKQKNLSVSDYVLETCIPDSIMVSTETPKPIDNSAIIRRCMKANCPSRDTQVYKIEGLNAWLCQLHRPS